jgi:hypothetical protein
VQLTHEFINPGWPAATIAKHCASSTGAWAHRCQGHLGHDRALWKAQSFRPSRCRCPALLCRLVQDLRRYLRRTLARPAWVRSSPSSPTRTTTIPQRREELMISPSIAGREVAEHAKAAGLTMCSGSRCRWAANSAIRSQMPGARRCLAQSGEAAIPMKMMVDIDHGDVTSPNPDDIDPYAWAKAFPTGIADHPHQAVFDEQGRPLAVHGPIQQGWPHHAGKAARCGSAGGGTDNEICLELSFRESEPTDHRVVDDDPRIRGILGASYRYGFQFRAQLISLMRHGQAPGSNAGRFGAGIDGGVERLVRTARRRKARRHWQR